MERPTKIRVIKKNDGYEIICMDEMSGSSIGIDMPTNGYLALAKHFRTGAMEISSDELSGLHKHIVTNRTFKCNRCGTIYTLIDGEVIGCCTATVYNRTSGICGGELIEVF